MTTSPLHPSLTLSALTLASRALGGIVMAGLPAPGDLRPLLLALSPAGRRNPSPGAGSAMRFQVMDERGIGRDQARRRSVGHLIPQGGTESSPVLRRLVARCHRAEATEVSQ